MKRYLNNLVVGVATVSLVLAASSSALAGGKGKGGSNGNGSGNGNSNGIGASARISSGIKLQSSNITSNNNVLSSNFGNVGKVSKSKDLSSSTLSNNTGIFTQKGPKASDLVLNAKIKDGVTKTPKYSDLVLNNKIKDGLQKGPKIGDLVKDQNKDKGSKNDKCDPSKDNCHPKKCWDPCFKYCWPTFCWDHVYTYPVYETIVVEKPVLVAQPVAVVDLQVLGVQFGDAGDMASGLGPRYRVTLRNNSNTPVGQFRVAMMAVVDNKPSPDAPPVFAMVEGLGAGETRALELRLPVTALKMAADAAGNPVPFSHLGIAADAENQIAESNEENNRVILDRQQIPAIQF